MKLNMMTCNRKYDQGFTLIEVMVAMVLGLILMAGVFQAFISSKDTQDIISDQVELVDESRITLEILAFDIKRSGLWGKTHTPEKLLDNITSFNAVRAKLATANDCVNALGDTNSALVGPTGWSMDVFRVTYGFSEEWIAANGFPYSNCISGAYLRGDTLEVRYAGEQIALGNLDDSTIYIVSQGQFSDVFWGAAVPPQPVLAAELWGTDPAIDPLVTYHRYEAVLYYVSAWTDGNSSSNDGIPSLRRVSLQGGPELVDDVVLTGVESLQVQFGMDLDHNESTQSVQRYMDPSFIVSTPTENQWSMVRSAQVWAVVRSRQSRTENTAQTFTIPAIPAGTYTTAADGLKRIMVSTVTKLRNIEFVDGQ